MKSLLNLLRRARRERELDAELQHYVAALALEKQRAGLSPGEAERAARIELGGAAQVKEAVRESLAGAWMEGLLQDLRYAARVLNRGRGFTAVVVLTLALGIGANTALFSVVHAFLLRGLPYREPGALVYVSEVWPHEPEVAGPPSPDFVNWRARGKSFSGLEAYGGGGALNLTGAGEPERIQSTRISAGFLDLLGVPPALGRSFTAQEDRLGGPPAAILGYSLWQRRFGGSPAALGQTIALDGVGRTIVGVLPASFVFPDNGVSAEIFVPMALPANHDWHDADHFRLLRVLARGKPGVTPAALRAELAAIVRGAAAEEPRQFVTMRRGMAVTVAPLRDRLAGNIRPVLLILQAAVALVLLIGCLNVANLQIARGLARRKEMALRAALGAARGRLARQVLTESLLLSGLGGASGLLLGFLALRYVRTFLPANLHLIATVRIDGAVLLFTLGIAAATGIVTSLAPALASRAANLDATLKQGAGRASVSAGGYRLRAALVVAEVALAMVLLAGSGLLMRSYVRLAGVDPGFDPTGVLTVRIPLPESKYAGRDAQVAFFSQLLERAETLPGVRSAAIGGGLPLIGARMGIGTVVDGRPLPPPGGAPTIPTAPVSPGYFRALHIAVRRGRAFGAADREGAPLVVIVNQAFADRFFPGQDAVGNGLRFSGVRPGPRREIVGIVGNVRQNGLYRDDAPAIYAPYRQLPDSDMLLILRSALPPAALIAESGRIVRDIDPGLPLADVASMNERIAAALSADRANMLLMGAFASLALLLAAIGIFGTIAYLVRQRAREIGIRMALGAQARDILKLIVRHSLILTGTGIAIGLAGAFAATRALRSLLYNTGPNDPLALAAAAAVFALAAMAACYLPARWAVHVDPATTLRHE